MVFHVTSRRSRDDRVRRPSYAWGYAFIAAVGLVVAVILALRPR